MEYDLEEEGPAVVGVAVSESRNSKHAVQWTLQKFVPEGINSIKLLHVRPKLTNAPTPMGNYVPVAQVRDDIAAAYKKDIEWKTNVLLLPYKQMCAERQVEAEIHVLEADDIATAISEEVVNSAINKLVIGSSSRGTLARKLKGDKSQCKIAESVPSFCTVYVLSSKGKLSSVRPSTSYCGGSARDDRSSTSISSSCRSSIESSVRSELTDTDTPLNISSIYSPSLQNQRNQALRAINQNFSDTKSNLESVYHSTSLSLSIEEDTMTSTSTHIDDENGFSRNSSYLSIRTGYQSRNSDQTSLTNSSTCSPTSENQVDVRFELERLRIELSDLQGIYENAQNETINASRKASELSTLCKEDMLKLKRLNHLEMKAREMARKESEAREAAEKEAEFVRECTQREVLDRKDAEESASRESKEKQRFRESLVSCGQQYKKFEWDDILSATSSLSEDLNIGKGASGTVYKGRLQHTTVAIKVLQANEVHRSKQFQQELEVLGRIRHPHVVLLMGACPDRGCLVYEYMENGSLSDILRYKDGAKPLRWFHRYKIAWEIASGLAFLHSSRPEPIVHRDLKPANILLDHNLVSKIGDVGLSTLIPTDSSMSTMLKNTAPVGTFCYIDPEYQRTGMVSPKSDIYSFGMVILQLLTAKRPMGLAHIVETAIDEGRLEDILDSKAGKWPADETRELAQLALGCLELRRKDRPDLQTEILPLLEKLKAVAHDARDMSHISVAPPNHFLCPILQEVMEEPCVAADGYTYDRKAIETWLRMNDKSPLTNLQLPNKNLIPNHSLLSAIKEWNSTN